VQRAERVTVLGLEPGQEARQVCPVAAVAAVFGNLPPAASGLESSDRIRMCEGDAQGE
jgi:hypothetical protein